MEKKPENSHRWEREENEWYVEPEWCSARLFDVEKFDGIILDPACGMGRILKTASAAGYKSVGFDIINRGPALFEHDFLSQKIVLDGPLTYAGENVVCNPPFNKFEAFAKSALDRDMKKVAMIWVTRRLNAARWLKKTPLSKILFLTPRPSMPPGHVIMQGKKPSNGKYDFCWLIWERGFTGAPTIDWLHRDGKP